MSKKNKHKQQQSNQKVDQPTGGLVITQTKQIPGVMACKFTHKTQDSTADFEWTGQPINAIWPQILAFFKWTYDKYHSESQVRLYVNGKTGEWAAWAYPQESKTGMSARELSDNDENYAKTKEQRAQFGDEWYYWGTVHHHCACSAFQSGTDEANERNQDGIHITVGFMDRDQYDIHFRIYVGGYKLKDVSPLEFWDTGDEMLTVPEKFRKLLPPNTEEMLCKQQMGVPPPKDTEFPQIWKDNIIDITPKAVVTTPSRMAAIHGSGNTYGFHKSYVARSTPGSAFDNRRAVARILEFIQSEECSGVKNLSDALKCLEVADSLLDADTINLLDICMQCDVLPGAVVQYVDEQIAMSEMERENRKMVAEGGHAPGLTGKTNHSGGNPPHWSDQDFSGYGHS